MNAGYNGWTNYETWCVNLWMDNSEASQNYWAEAAKEIYEQSEADETFTQAEVAIFALADRIKDEHEEEITSLYEQGSIAIASVWGDLMTNALKEVSWREIAKTSIDELDREAEA